MRVIGKWAFGHGPGKIGIAAAKKLIEQIIEQTAAVKGIAPLGKNIETFHGSIVECAAAKIQNQAPAANVGNRKNAEIQAGNQGRVRLLHKGNCRPAGFREAFAKGNREILAHPCGNANMDIGIFQQAIWKSLAQKGQEISHRFQGPGFSAVNFGLELGADFASAPRIRMGKIFAFRKVAYAERLAILIKNDSCQAAAGICYVLQDYGLWTTAAAPGGAVPGKYIGIACAEIYPDSFHVSIRWTRPRIVLPSFVRGRDNTRQRSPFFTSPTGS